MKKIFPYLLLLGLFIALYTTSQDTREDIKVEHHHYKNEPYEVVLETYNNRYICNDCAMMIKSYENSAQVVSPAGDVYFFDDVGCMIRWINRQNFKDKAKMYVYAKDTKAYIDAKIAWYIRDAVTPLGYGFGAYETSMGAILSAKTSSKIEGKFGNFRVKREQKEIYEFFEIEQYALRGETLLHPMIKHELLEMN